MSKISKTEISRRDFLNAGLTKAAVTVGCLRFGLKEALAQSERTKKLILTDVNLNKLVNEQARNNKLKEFAEAEPDPLAFLEKHFTVTDEQKRQFNTLSKEDKDTIGKAIDVMAKENGIVKWQFVTKKKKSGPRVILKLTQSKRGATSSRFFLPPVKGE
jgi:hypothetical protein